MAIRHRARRHRARRRCRPRQPARRLPQVEEADLHYDTKNKYKFRRSRLAWITGVFARQGGARVWGGGQLLPSRRSRPPPRPGSAAEDHPWLFKELRCGTCRAQAAVLCSRAWRFGRGPGNACTRLTCFA